MSSNYWQMQEQMRAMGKCANEIAAQVLANEFKRDRQRFRKSNTRTAAPDESAERVTGGEGRSNSEDSSGAASAVARVAAPKIL